VSASERVSVMSVREGVRACVGAWGARREHLQQLQPRGVDVISVDVEDAQHRRAGKQRGKERVSHVEAAWLQPVGDALERLTERVRVGIGGIQEGEEVATEGDQPPSGVHPPASTGHGAGLDVRRVSECARANARARMRVLVRVIGLAGAGSSV
jgi:hypothetical protein